MTLGQFKQRTGSYAPGFFMLGSVAMVTLIVLRVLMARSDRWQTSWRGAALAVPCCLAACARAHAGSRVTLVADARPARAIREPAGSTAESTP